MVTAVNETEQSGSLMIKFKLFGYGRSEQATPVPSQGETGQEARPSVETEPAKLNGKCVLIVDDDPVFLTATAAKLRSAGFQVNTAKEGPEAITALGEQRADTILLDINFPPDVGSGGTGSWDGFQLMIWLRGHPCARGTRFIMVSNSDSESDRRRAQKLGTVAYFQKPLDHAKLLAALNSEN